MYKILGADQKEYGPTSADQIRQWIIDGRVNGQTRVLAEGSNEWKPLSERSEFSEALASKGGTHGLRPSSGAGGTPPALPSMERPSGGLAITSLVLGIFSILGCVIVASVPAIITGHIALNRSRRSPRQFGKSGLAIAGLSMGYASLALLPIMAGLLLPALAKAKAKAQQINCVNNMKQIGLAARIWSNDHGDKFPPDIQAMAQELNSPKILVCPSDSSKVRAMNWSAFGPDNLSYEYLEPGVDEKDAMQRVIFRCPIHNNVGMGDGSVQMGGQLGRRPRR